MKTPARMHSPSNLFNLLSLSWFVALSALGEAPAGWKTNYTAALAQARREQQPCLVWFTASWCGPCREMARSVLVAPAVAQTLTNLNRVAIDIDEQEALAQQRGVRAVPTFQMLSPEGDALASLVGYQAPEPFLEWLTNSLREVKDSLLRQHRSEQRLAAAEQALRQSGARADPEAIRELLALYAEQSSAVRDPAGARLAALAQSQPALLLDGLNHPRLAVRIHVANLLRRRLGEAFNIDPWSDAAARRQAVAQWQQKLSSTAR